MHFFRAREAADEWVGEREGVVALSLSDAFELAHEHWVVRSKRSAESLGGTSDTDPWQVRTGATGSSNDPEAGNDGRKSSRPVPGA